MRIHELLETCVEYIAYDGVVGSDPTRLLQHLVKLESSVDHDYFAHIWTLLCTLPSIQIIIASHPILIPGGTTDLGTAPLPPDWEPPQHVGTNIDLSTLYRDGVKGRQLAYMLAGKEFKTGKQLLDDRRQARNKPKTQNNDEEDELSGTPAGGIKVEDGGQSFLSVLGGDDGGTGDDTPDLDKIPTTDFRRLSAKWGARLRIRCTENEIYYRLTGSHQKMSRITSIVFHILQLTAMSRDKGITAIDLGPLVGSSQGSMHYFMKVLVGLGLCTKIPCVLHGAITNLLVYHRFLDQNPNYLSLIGKTVPSDPAMQSNDDAAMDVDVGEEEENGDDVVDPNVDDLRSIDEWGFNFGSLSEADLMAGHMVRHRLLNMLEHPMLKNHLLATKNLLVPLGWSGPSVTRHRRAVLRQIDALVSDGIVERIAVGERETACIRLVKYNPDKSSAINEKEDNVHAIDEEEKDTPDLQEIAAQPPYGPPGGIPLTVSVEYSIHELVARSGANGITINEIWYDTSYMQKRGVDFAVLRADSAPIPSHLWSLGISSTMETVGKERRLRLFTTEAYQKLMLASGQELEGYAAILRPDNADQWADVSHKHFYASLEEYHLLVDQGAFATPAGPVKKAAGRTGHAVKRQKPKTARAGADGRKTDKDSILERAKAFRYTTENQVRGRPRKYVHVVEEDGKVNRRIIGTVYTRPDLPPILVYMKKRNLLVEAPSDYTGIGPPPQCSDEAIKNGKPPDWYFKFPTQHAAAHSGTKGKAKKKVRNTSQAGSDKEGGGPVLATTKKPGKRKGKRADQNGNGITSESIVQAEVRKSKRQKKAVKYKDAGETNRDGHDERVADEPAVGGVSANVQAGPSNLVAQSNISIPQTPMAETVPSSSMPAITSTHPPLDPAHLEDSSGRDVPVADSIVDIDCQSDAIPTPAALPRLRRNGKARQKQEPVDKAEQKDKAVPKRTRGRKSKAAEVEKTPLVDTPQPVQPPEQSTHPPAVDEETAKDILPRSPTLPPQTDDPVTIETEQSPGSMRAEADRSVTFDEIPLSNTPMETSIGSILVELAQSGLLVRSREASDICLQQNLAKSPSGSALGSVAQSEATPLVTSQPDSGGSTSAASSHLDSAQTPAAAQSSRKRKVSLGVNPSATPVPEVTKKKAKVFKAAEAVHNEDASPFTITQQSLTPRRSIFNISQEPMEEVPFELPAGMIGEVEGNRAVSKCSEDADERKGIESIEVMPTPTKPVVKPQRDEDVQEQRSETVAASDPMVPSDASEPSYARPVTPAIPQARSTGTSMGPPATPAPILAAPQYGTSIGGSGLELTSPAASRGPRARSMSGTPLREVQEPSRSLLSRVLDPAEQTQSDGTSAGRTRIDLGTIRRANELHQCLVDSGGILIRNKLQSEHRDWAHKYAGTDHPNAPSVAHGMDRTHIKKVTSALLKDGRLKETIVSTPTPTGRWVKTAVVYTSDLPDEQRQEYIRQMSTMMSQMITPLKKDLRRPTTSLPATPFTEIKGSTPKTGNKIVTQDPRNNDQVINHRHYSETRASLVQEINVVAQLYGWKAGRCVRAQVLHRAILEAFSDTSSTSIISSSPKIFALPLLFEDITVGDWFACVLTLQFNEELEQWMHDPAHRALKVKQVPKHLKPSGGFGGHSTKNKLATLLQILVSLKIISPIFPANPANADIFADQSSMEGGGGFKLGEAGVWATYYLVHDYAPVYHLALDARPFLGLVPAKVDSDLDHLWSSIKDASLHSEVDISDNITNEVKPVFPTTARVPDVSDIGTEHSRILQHRTRWRDEIHLLQIQREALNAAINWQKAERVLTTKEQVENLAYRYALRPAFVDAELDRRVSLARDKIARRAARLRESVLRARDRQQKIQNSLRERLSERQQANRREWEARIEASAVRKGVHYDVEMLEFVSRQTIITSGSMKQLQLSDAMLDHWAGIWNLCRGMTVPEREQMLEDRRKQNQERQRLLAPKLKWTRSKADSTKSNPKGTTTQRRTRSKRKWSTEDDDLFLDAEAVIRARSRTNGYKGRAAMSQYYPDISTQTFLARIRKITAQPGKLAYLDRLEQAWYDVWVQYRGTAELPDADPDSSTEFDLKRHVEFLRAKVDKKSLRLLAVSTPMEEKDRAPDLPPEESKVSDDYTWTYVKVEEHTFDNIANSSSAEEIRVAQLAHLSLYSEPSSASSRWRSDRDTGLLEAALKMIVGTATTVYDPADGDDLLSKWGSGTTEAAIADLVDRGIIKKHHTSGSTAGRFYDFTPQWQQLSDGALPDNLPVEAKGLHEMLERDKSGIEWPIIGRSGELAALMNMVSNHEVDFEFEIDEFPTIKFESDHYNTRKLNDDVYEFDFGVKRLESSLSRTGGSITTLPDPQLCKPPSNWDLTVDSTQETQHHVVKATDLVATAGPDGMTKPELLQALGCSLDTMNMTLASLASPTAEKSPVFWAGYDTARLVSRKHWDSWTVTTRAPSSLLRHAEDSRPDAQTKPRRWCDLYGRFMEGEWNRALHAVIAQVAARPGLSERRLRETMQMILDRLEMNDVLDYLLTQGNLKRCPIGTESFLPPVEAMDVTEEEGAGWWCDIEKMWTT
ncbi:hypothetical protein IAR55_000851 [Kwoniella newhampshirensis]|uniref:B-block binding subunit of TFIIIC domain-containing protein n=1 Tax=Kwoniella newhampshirensis TaxID=1651941 RepID=A0AAW0Z454_9TREE